MSAYTDPGQWCHPLTGILYESTLPLVWDIGVKGSGDTVIVPAGTVFDVSIPRSLRWLFDPHNPAYLKAAALHDEMLRLGWTRIMAGAVFHDALKADGVSRWRRLAMWFAVSVFKYQ